MAILLKGYIIVIAGQATFDDRLTCWSGELSDQQVHIMCLLDNKYFFRYAYLFSTKQSGVSNCYTITCCYFIRNLQTYSNKGNQGHYGNKFIVFITIAFSASEL